MIGSSLRFGKQQRKNSCNTAIIIFKPTIYTEYGAFVGRGDSTKVFVELGYLQRLNDSLQNSFLQKVNTSLNRIYFEIEINAD
ncbi:hypothetical protein QWY90_01630 [Flavobacterium paronense]|uniref:hypothetical protein n=1 Tax=Flavobacterium paronense TaxID=1392775 RepID=UPI0025B35D6C|nr:hypothetical protein [Flavobacterium paronense]MDN3676008.1 hypothetical protein [Flavobacterium paronense]